MHPVRVVTTSLDKLEKRWICYPGHASSNVREERISKKEAREIEKRLPAYRRGDKSEFVSLEDVRDTERKNK
jgi:hypothetical protein